MIENTNVLFNIAGLGITLTDIASVATSIGLIVAVFQLALDRSVRKEAAKRSSINEAVNIAKLFQTKLINAIGFVESVFYETGLKKFVDEKVPQCTPLRFTREEAMELVSEDCDTIINRYRDKETLDVLMKAAYQCPQFVFNTAPSSSDSNSKETNEKITYRNKHIRYVDTRTEILNTLEWAAMLFCTGVADDNVVYQSLHKIFIDIIHENYFYIACHNSDDNACDQLFCNIISLYNTWVKKCNKMRKKDCKRKHKQQKRIERIKCREKRERTKAIVQGPHM